jgi:hypothetical protein
LNDSVAKFQAAPKGYVTATAPALARDVGAMRRYRNAVADLL